MRTRLSNKYQQVVMTATTVDTADVRCVVLLPSGKVRGRLMRDNCPVVKDSLYAPTWHIVPSIK